MLEVQLVFKYFANQQWIYQSNVVDNVMAKMSPEDKRDFQFNVRNIDWLNCFALFSYGLRRFFIKEDCMQPGQQFKQLLFKNQIPLAHDLTTAFKQKIAGFKTNTSYFKDVMLPHKFQDFLQMQKTHEQVLSFDERSAREQLRELQTTITPYGVRALLWFFNKSFRHALRGLYVETASLGKNVKEQLDAGSRVVLMPIYRSWADFFIISYV